MSPWGHGASWWIEHRRDRFSSVERGARDGRARLLRRSHSTSPRYCRFIVINAAEWDTDSCDAFVPSTCVLQSGRDAWLAIAFGLEEQRPHIRQEPRLNGWLYSRGWRVEPFRLDNDEKMSSSTWFLFPNESMECFLQEYICVEGRIIVK